MRAGAAARRRRVDDSGSPTRQPAAHRPRPRGAELARRLAAAVGRRVGPDAGRVRRPGASRRRSRSRWSGERLAALPGPAAARRPAGLPRHGDHRPRRRRRHARVPRRPRLVGGRPVPAGPAALPGPRGRAGAARRARGRDPARRVARHVQRPGLRLAAPRDPLPAAAPGRARPRRPPRPAAASSAASSATGCGDARLQTVERELLGVHRARGRGRLGDPGALPRVRAGRAGGPARGRRDATTPRTSDRSARLLGHLDARLRRRRPAAAGAPPAISFALARGIRPARRGSTTPSACLDAADDALGGHPRSGRRPGPTARPAAGADARLARADPRRAGPDAPPPRAPRRGRSRRGRRSRAAVAARTPCAPGSRSAKLREHLLRDPAGALEATAGRTVLDWLRSLDAPSRRWRPRLGDPPAAAWATTAPARRRTAAVIVSPAGAA